MDGKRQILGHLFVNFDCVNACLLELMREPEEILVIVEVGSMSKPTGPCKDGSDRVGGCRVTLVIVCLVIRAYSHH